MILRRGIKHHVNVGNYEAVDISAEVEYEVKDDDRSADVADMMQQHLDLLVEEDLREVKKIFPDDLSFESYVIPWKEESK